MAEHTKLIVPFVVMLFHSHGAKREPKVASRSWPIERIWIDLPPKKKKQEKLLELEPHGEMLTKTLNDFLGVVIALSEGPGEKSRESRIPRFTLLAAIFSMVGISLPMT